MDEITETIRSRIKNEASFLTKAGDYIVTASLGYSTYCNNWTADEFIKMSDKAQYASKNTGKNKVIKYGSDEYLTYEKSELEKTSQTIVDEVAKG
jgi:PleD family two-component response regulator